MAHKSLHLGVVISILYTVQCAHIMLLSGWSGGMTGDVFIHPDHSIHGWKVHLYFEYEYDILETGFGKVTRINAHEWMIENSPYNGNVNKGDTLTVYFVARSGHWDESATKEHTGTYTVEVLPHGQTTSTHVPTSSQTTVTTSVPIVTTSQPPILTKTPTPPSSVTSTTLSTSTSFVFTATSPNIKRTVQRRYFKLFRTMIRT